MSENPYFEILRALARAKVEFIIGGGVACVLQGVERVTMDVDLALLMTPGNWGEFLKIMRSLNLTPRVPIAPESLLDAGVVRMILEEKHALVFSFVDVNRPIRHVDIFLRPDLSFESLLPDTEWINLGEYAVRVVNKRRLLQLKLGIHPPRTKDALDIEFLRQHVR